MDKANNLTEKESAALEEKTREQRKSRFWHAERKFRITASNFGTVCKATEKRDISALCSSLFDPPPFRTEAVVHGNKYESKALCEFSKKHEKIVVPSGLFVDPSLPFLGATPDGKISREKNIVEVKCPFSAREEKVQPGKLFPFLEKDGDKICIKKTHSYYYQIQGQLGISKMNSCYFIVYTFHDLYVEKVDFNPVFYAEMVAKLQDFYEKQYRPYIASKF